jgi:hypothetical protein
VKTPTTSASTASNTHPRVVGAGGGPLGRVHARNRSATVVVTDPFWPTDPYPGVTLTTLPAAPPDYAAGMTLRRLIPAG